MERYQIPCIFKKPDILPRMGREKRERRMLWGFEKVIAVRFYHFKSDISLIQHPERNGSCIFEAHLTMLTLDTILKELKEVPLNRLQDLYSFIRSLKADVKRSDTSREKILSFAGCFSDMTDKQYDEFVEETKKTRATLFDRDIPI